MTVVPWSCYFYWSCSLILSPLCSKKRKREREKSNNKHTGVPIQHLQYLDPHYSSRVVNDDYFLCICLGVVTSLGISGWQKISTITHIPSIRKYQIEVTTPRQTDRYGTVPRWEQNRTEQNIERERGGPTPHKRNTSDSRKENMRRDCDSRGDYHGPGPAISLSFSLCLSLFLFIGSISVCFIFIPRF